jgi:hypothetical protein
MVAGVVNVAAGVQQFARLDRLIRFVGVHRSPGEIVHAQPQRRRDENGKRQRAEQETGHG